MNRILTFYMHYPPGDSDISTGLSTAHKQGIAVTRFKTRVNVACSVTHNSIPKIHADSQCCKNYWLSPFARLNRLHDVGNCINTDDSHGWVSATHKGLRFITVSHGSAYTVVRVTQQVNGKWQFWGCQNSVTPELHDWLKIWHTWLCRWVDLVCQIS